MSAGISIWSLKKMPIREVVWYIEENSMLNFKLGWPI